MNAHLTTTDPENYQRWDRAWERALDARGKEILKEMCDIDVGSASLVCGPDQTEGALRPDRVPQTDRVYLARHDSGQVDVFQIVVQADEDPNFERKILSRMPRPFPCVTCSTGRCRVWRSGPPRNPSK